MASDFLGGSDFFVLSGCQFICLFFLMGTLVVRQLKFCYWVKLKGLLYKNDRSIQVSIC